VQSVDPGSSLVAVLLGSDLLQTRARLASAQGYAVIDRDGKRIGLFVEIVDEGQVAIRHDGTFVWHRRLLPIGTVAKVVPERRLVVLSVDRKALVRSGRTWAAAKEGELEPELTSVRDLNERLTPYIPIEEDRQSPESGPTQRRNVDQHLLFIATSSGYVLLEGEGAPPPLGAGIEVRDQADRFSVMKVGPSPLPNDARSCAYLEPTE
jgi:hypothetical protein